MRALPPLPGPPRHLFLQWRTGRSSARRAFPATALLGHSAKPLFRELAASASDRKPPAPEKTLPSPGRANFFSTPRSWLALFFGVFRDQRRHRPAVRAKIRLRHPLHVGLGYRGIILRGIE